MENVRQEYLDYVSEFIKVRDLDQSTEFLFPLFDHKGDQLSVYIEKNDDDYFITDDGYFITNLLISGINLKGKRQEAIEHLCGMNNIRLLDTELQMQTTRECLAQDLHTFGQVLLQIDDMYLTAKNRVTSFFLDDVKQLFDDNDVPYVSSIEIRGRSGLNQAIQFCFSRNRNHPERLCLTVNNATREKAMNSAFIWEDIKSNRDQGAEFVVIFNDENKVFPEFNSVLNKYGVKSFKFSELSANLSYFS